ncbi:condensation domain-containing protein [Nocardioides marmotae]|uniref:condensation domain-containing protein n=1 Tax=Nocardioides marmotae TaxID=2663857 RepID=UPI00165943DA|nr:condensation domain-containing protein [Nocardioides marmotae]MBC9731660.1 hypothetical protein [Nocardioides marmotae]
MEYTELDAYPLSGGRLTTWTPEVAAPAWRDDPRGLSWDHGQHLRGGETGSWIGSVLRLPVRYDNDTVRRGLRAWLMRHEALRTTVLPAGDGWARRTADADDIDVVPVEHGELPAEEVRRQIEQCFATVAPGRWPHLRVATVDPGDGGGLVLAFGADHSVMDAYSQLLWFGEIALALERVAAGDAEEDCLDDTIASYVDHSATDRATGDAVGPDHAVVERWRTLLDEHGGFPAYPDTDLARGAGPARQHSTSTWVATASEADRLGEVCRAAGAGTQTGALALFSLAVRRLLGAERLSYVLPLHTRHDPGHASSVGWYVGCAPLTVDLAGTTGLTGALARVESAVRAAKPCARIPLPRVADLLGTDDHPHLVVSFVDTRYVPGSRHWPEWEARALRSPAHADDEVYLWLVRSHLGLSVSTRFPATDAAAAAMERLLDALREGVLDAIEPAEPAVDTVDTIAGESAGIAAEAVYA